ncbi:MAG: D-alanyl-D-alanine carboxypeptidase [Kiritimatiellae bacterium]|nr:D-alanyl-D-alanine carboxypeptidase [Kiritimatiellia bacterium]
MKKISVLFALFLSLAAAASAASIARSPYVGAIVVDAADGRVLFEDRADAAAYPASCLKLMDLMLVLDRVADGRLSLSGEVTASRAASQMGGSQVYLAEGEHFPLEDMLYALMIQSANDAALAIAEHVAGTREGFVSLMNQKAKELGMATTRFHSPHGLPPGKGQQPDVSTPRDFAKLCTALLREHPEALRYTSETYRVFRQNPLFEMRSHNHLLGSVGGCDGLKTGYFRDAGYSIAATAARDGRRAIVVVMGSPTREERDAKARELLGMYLLEAKQVAPAAAPAAPADEFPQVASQVTDDAAEGEEAAGEEEETVEIVPEEEAPPKAKSPWPGRIGWFLLGAFVSAVGFSVSARRKNRYGVAR